MYKKYGFYEIGCYNDSPMDSSIYMRLEFLMYAQEHLKNV